MAGRGLRSILRVKLLQDSLRLCKVSQVSQVSPAPQELKLAANDSLHKNWDRPVHVGTGSGGRSGELPVRNPPDDVPFSVKGLNHVAVAVPDLEAAAEHYRTLFGAQVQGPLDQPEHGVRVVFVKLCNATIELIHPLGEGGPLSKFLKRNPNGGIHHICFTVSDVHAAAEHMGESKIKLVGHGKPTLGAHDNPVIFLNPKDNFGVLYELEQVTVAEPGHDSAKRGTDNF